MRGRPSSTGHVDRTAFRFSHQDRCGFSLPLAVIAVLVAATPGWAGQRPARTKVRRHHISRHVTQTTDRLVEIETDAERDKYEDGSFGTQLTTTGRVRLGDGLQLNLQVPVLSASGSGAMRVGDVAAGVNWLLLEDVPLIGNVSALPTIKLPSGSVEFATGTGTADLAIAVIASRPLGRVDIDLSAGYTRRSGDGAVAPRHSTIWGVALDGPLPRAFGWNLELWGLPATGGAAGTPASSTVTAGPTWDVRDWLAVEAAIMTSISGPSSKAVFISAVYRSAKPALRP